MSTTDFAAFLDWLEENIQHISDQQYRMIEDVMYTEGVGRFVDIPLQPEDDTEIAQ